MNDPAFTALDAQREDAADPLAGFAAEFHHPHDAAGRKLLYLCGHSLGLQPKRAAQFVNQEMQAWAEFGVEGHFRGSRPWVSYHEQLSAPLAQLCGALDSEVVAMNSLTVNLHLMMVSFFQPRGERNCILMEHSAFPSDRYAVVSQLRYHGLSERTHLLELKPRQSERLLRTEDMLSAIEQAGNRLALVLLPGVQYLTGQLLDLEPLIAAAHRVGARVGVDLAHAIGNCPLRLHDWKADFAVWCSYKYLNGGPGAIGGCFVHEAHARAQLPRFAGWWGHDKAARFLFEPEFKPIAGAEGWQLSNPPVLSAAPLLASLQQFSRAGFEQLRRKSLRLTGYLRAAIDRRLSRQVEVITPCAPEQSGCQLSLRLLRDAAAAKRCHERLGAAGMVVDWREPDVIRIAPTPLYNSYSDVYAAVETLSAALDP